MPLNMSVEDVKSNLKRGTTTDVVRLNTVVNGSRKEMETGLLWLMCCKCCNFVSLGMTGSSRWMIFRPSDQVGVDGTVCRVVFVEY